MEWRDLKVFVKKTEVLEDYTGLYMVSSTGKIKDSEGNEVPQTPSKKYYPYMSVHIKDRNGKVRERLVHRIVASTFKDICGEFNEVVNHLDEDKWNNSAENLSWTTNRENLQWGTIRERAAESRRTHKMIPEKVKINYSELLFNF